MCSVVLLYKDRVELPENRCSHLCNLIAKVSYNITPEMQPEAANASCTAGVSLKGKHRAVRVVTFCPINTVKITHSPLSYTSKSMDILAVSKNWGQNILEYTFAIINDIQIGEILVVIN